MWRCGPKIKVSFSCSHSLCYVRCLLIVNTYTYWNLFLFLLCARHSLKMLRSWVILRKSVWKFVAKLLLEFVFSWTNSLGIIDIRHYRVSKARNSVNSVILSVTYSRTVLKNGNVTQCINCMCLKREIKNEVIQEVLLFSFLIWKIK